MNDKNNILLSILIIGKNDNYGCDANGKGGVNKRLELGLNKLINNLNRLNANNVEVVLCDWGSEDKIIDNLIHDKCNNFKSVYVPDDICIKYNKHFSISHAYNTAYRHSSGKYVIFWDSDCFVDYESFVQLYKVVKAIDDQNINDFFWWCSRRHIPREGYIDCGGFDEVDLYIKQNPSSIHWEKLDTKHFGGCAIALLLPRTIADESSCWYEKLPNWGWQDIELHRRLLTKYKCDIDLSLYGINMYHFYHHDVDHRKEQNLWLNSNTFHANEENWGLKNEILKIKYLNNKEI